MARTRQKRKAKQRQQQQATRRDATAKQQPSNPAEEAVIQTADALEAGDELEEIARSEEPEVVAAPPEQVGAAGDGEPVAHDGEAPDDGEAADDGERVAAAQAPAAPAKRRERRPAAPAPAKQPRQEKRRERKATPAERRKEARQRGRVMNFMVQVWAELRRVQWPDRNQVTHATGVVVVFCFLAGAFLAFWDFVFGELVTSIL
jgi:preprotein translocase subunit SecE